MSKCYPSLPLFAKTNNSHPSTSRMAAESLSINNAEKLSNRLSAVLRALNANNGITAKALGKIMAQQDAERLSWPHKRMAQLEELKLIERKLPENGKELICFVTEKGKRWINGST